LPNYICSTCGVQYAESVLPPEHCTVCEDERQYVGLEGQKWTTMKELQKTHTNRLDVEGPELISLVTEPKFAIGQRALHVRTPDGNVLWDCITLVDDRSVAAIQALGGVSAIAISHPHYYASMVEWSRALGDVPIYLHAADGDWVMRPHPAIVFWHGDTHVLHPGSPCSGWVDTFPERRCCIGREVPGEGACCSAETCFRSVKIGNR
jgi:hypothetical protein